MQSCTSPVPYSSRLHHLLLVLLLLLTAPMAILAQSTQGSILGSVKDSAGALISGAPVKLTSNDEGTIRTTVSSSSGDYSFLDVKAGSYTLEISQPGFEKWSVSGAVLTTQQQLRLDATLVVGSIDQVVQVSGDSVAAIDTDSPSVSAVYSSADVANLPVNTRASAAGTSAYNIVGSLAGVQADGNGGNLVFSVQGGLPFQSETSVDGITVRNAAGGNRAIGDAFPSSESINEIRADGVLNNAEYGQPGQITLTTKAGTNTIHGGIFWYHQNAAFDAIPFTNPTTKVKPKLIANTFGGSFGGPVVIPHFYNGHNRTFIFGAYEGWRHPSTLPFTYKVPSTLMKQGEFSPSTFRNGVRRLPDQPFYRRQLRNSNYRPSTPRQQKLLTFYPDPNIGDPTVYTDDGVAELPSSTKIHQRDLGPVRHTRATNIFGANQKFLVWGRFTWKELSRSIVLNLLNVPSSQQQANKKRMC